eukprot:gene8021-10870_t
MNIDHSQIPGFVLLYFSCSIAAAGGIGGGGLNVPILLIIMKYSYHDAVILSLCTVLGNYIAQTSINWNKRHPKYKNRPLIYWDGVLVVLPAQLGGSNVGVIISQIFPESILLVLAMIVLCYASVITCKKGFNLWKRETTENLSNRLSLVKICDDEEEEEALRSAMNPFHKAFTAAHWYLVGTTAEIAAQKQRRNVEGGRTLSHESLSISELSSNLEAMVWPWDIIKVLAVIWVVYASIYVTAQTADGHNNSESIHEQFNNNFSQSNSNYYLTKDEIDFKSFTIIPSLSSFLIGILCSLLGIGGGELLGPLLLSYSLLPQVTSATTSTLSLLNSSSTILHYIIMNDINYPIAGIVFGIGLVGGFTGRMTALFVSTKFNLDKRDFAFHSLCN